MTFKSIVMSGKCFNTMRNLFNEIQCNLNCACCGDLVIDKVSCDLDIMESSSFYLTLPSNASSDIYPGNSAASFQIRLPRTMYLKNKYEIALAEIQYPHTWDTFSNDDDYKFQVRRGDERITFDVSPGYYKNIHDLVTELNKSVINVLADEACIVLKYHNVSRKIKIILRDGCAVSFKQGLADVLGFEPYKVYTESFESSYYSDIHRGFYTLYVYCNICEPQVVGNYCVPLLRAVHIAGEHGEFVNKTYTEPHYVPINTNKFDVIEIEIKNDIGENVSFKTGKVICKLHFRQKAL